MTRNQPVDIKIFSEYYRDMRISVSRKYLPYGSRNQNIILNDIGWFESSRTGTAIKDKLDSIMDKL